MRRRPERPTARRENDRQATAPARDLAATIGYAHRHHIG